MYVFSAITLLAAEAAEEGHHTTSPLTPAAGELIWGFVAFVALFLILRKTAFPTIIKTLEARTEGIEGQLDRAERERREAEELLAQYRQKLNEADAEATRIIATARANADRLEMELRARAEEQATRIIDRAEQTIRAERDRAIQQLRNEVGTLAVDLATRLLGDSLDRERHLRLVDQYIDELPKPQAG